MNKCLLFVTVFAILAASVLATDISTCQELNVPGNYNLVADIRGNAGIIAFGASQRQSCIMITSDDVTLDCMGHYISRGGVLTKSGSAVTIGVSGSPLRNVKVTNCEIFVNNQASEGCGIQTEYGHHELEISYNNIHNNVSNPLSTACGVGTGSSAIMNNSVFKYNNIHGLRSGFGFACGTTNCTVENTFTYNNVSNFTAYFIESSAAYAILSGNIFHHNIINGTGAGSGNIHNMAAMSQNTWNNPSGGNVWADVNNIDGYSNFCTDANADLVCDSAYSLTATNIDNFPLKAITAAPVPVCLKSNGCYLNETFSYIDTILNHGWGGWGTTPTDTLYTQGELMCSPGSSAFYWREFDNTGVASTVILNFRARICGDPLSALNLWLGSGNDVAINLWFFGDNTTGYIRGGDYSDIGVLGQNVTDDGGWLCSGFKAFDNNYTLVMYPQNTPRTYDFYENGALLKAGITWTDAGQSMNGLNFLYLSGSYAGNKCFWYVDDISLTGIPINITSDVLARNVFGPWNMNNGTFDYSVCGPTENRLVCAARSSIGSLLGWLWRLMVNNILETLALLSVIGLGVFVKIKYGRGG